jgi:hypothetical protein
LSIETRRTELSTRARSDLVVRGSLFYDVRRGLTSAIDHGFGRHRPIAAEIIEVTKYRQTGISAFGRRTAVSIRAGTVSRACHEARK